jgi:hypothetical protein
VELETAMDIVVIAVGILAALCIILYATWLLMTRLRRGEQKTKSFGEWLKHLFEAIWGL